MAGEDVLGVGLDSAHSDSCCVGQGKIALSHGGFNDYRVLLKNNVTLGTGTVTYGLKKPV